MNIEQTVRRFVGRYGCSVSLSADGTTFGTPYQAFVQPLRYKNKMYLEGTMTRIGYADQSHYLYVGPGDVEICGLSEKAVLLMDNVRYRISRAERVVLADATVYNWAVIRPCVGGETA